MLTETIYEALIAKLHRTPTDGEFRAALAAAARRRAATQAYRIG